MTMVLATDNYDPKKLQKYYDRVAPRLGEIANWCRRGVQRADIAYNLGIGESTLVKYTKTFPELKRAMAIANEVADLRVEDALYKRAIGYTYEEETWERKRIVTDENEYAEELVLTKLVKKQMAPDVSAQVFWLTNRKKESWRNKPEPVQQDSNDKAITKWLEATKLPSKDVQTLFDNTVESQNSSSKEAK